MRGMKTSKQTTVGRTTRRWLDAVERNVEMFKCRNCRSSAVDQAPGGGSLKWARLKVDCTSIEYEEEGEQEGEGEEEEEDEEEGEEKEEE